MSEYGSPPATHTSTRNARAWAYALGASLTGGLALGVLTNLAQGWLPGAWNQVANSGAVWSVAAFAAGALLAGRSSLPIAAFGGLCAEAGLVIGYYGYAEFGRDGMGSLFFPLVWLAIAFVAGPIFGIAGLWWRRGSSGQRVTALAALAGVFGMEAIYYAWVLNYTPQALASLAVFLLVPLLMARTHKERALALLVAVPFSLLAYAIVELPLQLISE
ncbi:hypothetical protein Aple_011190 [Acrocarpospora pleiomorpha]|uniref:Uncharacterized protein n=1 Tax=Acrocarpospora pleiomorpha TaxID=90975 RepID=A0A5M3XAQ5_9ACTN|nr:DUF6518 family protein [Acrocarpospora pleiomorpha]GES18224.1 hypothetical protein Aple_011190 [Acrocarpospora pleiomorpha]